MAAAPHLVDALLRMGAHEEGEGLLG
jgi:hypothetical protein